MKHANELYANECVSGDHLRSVEDIVKSVNKFFNIYCSFKIEGTNVLV